jgi:hypothetical protein
MGTVERDYPDRPNPDETTVGALGNESTPRNSMASPFDDNGASAGLNQRLGVGWTD